MSRAVSADGTAIAYRRVGHGPLVVLVGGAFLGRTDTLLADGLAGCATVVTYDRRGRGASGDTRPYAVRREVEDLEAVIAAVGGPARVFGRGFGGILALEAAAAGAAVSRLAVFEPPYLVDPEHPPPPSHRELAELVGRGRRGEAVELFLTRAADVPAEVVAGLRHGPCWACLEAAAHTLGYEAALVGPGPVPERRLASVVIPALVLAGAGSSARTRRAAVAVTEALPDATLTMLVGPADLATAVVPFLTA